MRTHELKYFAFKSYFDFYKILGGENCTLTGWGYTNPFRVGFPPNDLQRAFLPTLTNEKCREDGMNVTNTEICTYSHFLQGACGVSAGDLKKTQQYCLNLQHFLMCLIKLQIKINFRVTAVDL